MYYFYTHQIYNNLPIPTSPFRNSFSLSKKVDHVLLASIASNSQRRSSSTLHKETFSEVLIKQNSKDYSMGNSDTHPLPSPPISIPKQHRHTITLPTPAKPPSKTDFFYLHPLPDLDVDLPLTEQQEQDTSQGHTKIKIEEIKVKWMSFLKMKQGSFLHQYQVRRQLGRGGFGCVYKVRGKYTGIIRAAKKIKKSDMDAKQHERLFNEVKILQSLDHPNIAKLYEVYDHEDHYVLIMELCEGGELFKRIAKSQITVSQAAKITKQLLEALAYIHSKDIVHRDIKPENILFQRETGSIKVIDFGIAVQKKNPKEILNSRIGTAYYIAPQVLCKKYDEKCDVWATGVVLFMMLLKRPPFNGSSETQIMQAILTEEISYQGKEWTELTTQCKQLLMGLLRKKPKQRPSAFQALQSKWLQNLQAIVRPQNLDVTLGRMQQFGFRNRLQAVVYTYTVSQLLTSTQKLGLQQIFKRADTNGDGTICPAQFKTIMQDRIKDQQRLQLMMRLIDLDGSGKIEYTEFLIAALNPKSYLKKEHYERAFQYFDIDHSGDISYEEIARFLEGKESQESIRRIFCQIDINGDGHISKEEFLELFMRERVKTTLERLKATKKAPCKERTMDKGINKSQRISNSKNKK